MSGTSRKCVACGIPYKEVFESLCIYVILLAIPAVFYLWQAGNSLVSTVDNFMITGTKMFNTSVFVTAINLFGILGKVLEILMALFTLLRPLMWRHKRTHFVCKIVLCCVIVLCLACQIITFVNHMLLAEVYDMAVQVVYYLLQCVGYALCLLVLLCNRISVKVRVLLTLICVVLLYGVSWYAQITTLVRLLPSERSYIRLAWRFIVNELVLSWSRACVVFFAIAPMRKREEDVK